MVKKIIILTIEEKNNLIEYLKEKIYHISISQNQKCSLRSRAEYLCTVDEITWYKILTGHLSSFMFDFETSLIDIVFNQEHRIGHIYTTKMNKIINKKYSVISLQQIALFAVSCE